jgi:hypothetical protein
VILRSLTARVVVAALLVVSAVLVGGGLTVVTVTEQRDKRDADAELRRFAGSLTPSVAGALGVAPRPPPGRLLSPPPGLGEVVILDRNGNPIGAGPGPPRRLGAPGSPQPSL